MQMDGVVVLHGIFRTPRSMQGLAKHLQRNGYRVLNLGYPSTRLSLEQLAAHIHPQVDAFNQASPNKLHFAGHSMGGLLIRAYLHRYRPPNLGRVVMLGTPNQGSEVADWLQAWKPYRILYGPAGQELVTASPLHVRLSDRVDYELGVIAGNRSIDPVSSWIIGVPNDGKVAVESTRLPGMKEHVIIPQNHTFLPASRTAWQLTTCFLDSGGFQRPR